MRLTAVRGPSIQIRISTATASTQQMRLDALVRRTESEARSSYSPASHIAVRCSGVNHLIGDDISVL